MKKRLELTWIGKENRARLGPRILLEGSEYSHHAAQHGGKPWRYLVIPHDQIEANRTLSGLAAAYELRPGD